MRPLLKKVFNLTHLYFSAIIDGTCAVSSSAQQPCLADGEEIESVSKCASAECCFQEEPFTKKINCYKRKGEIF